MPTTVNGIGTWYYGKRRIHTRKGTCEFCGSVTTLSSYDTTLFFVVVFVPLIPLARKRILEQCAVCQQHRVMPLAKWEEAKINDGARVLDNLQNNPDDRQAVLEAISLAIAYQDEPLFQQIIEPIAADLRNDAAVQLQMGDAYTYFARWPQAERAYRASMEAEDTEFSREGLAWALLKQARADEARPYLQHILDNKKQQGAGLIYYLVHGYQAEGLHDEALALMDERDKAFPELVGLKEYQQQRNTSTRYRGSDKRIRSSILNEGGKTGYRHGGWSARVPRWIVAGIFLGALALYFGSAIWIGMARKVFLVNGTNKAYTVSVAGHEHTLPPRGAVPVRVAEGVVEVSFADKRLGLPPIQCTVETSFWSRPFTSPTFVINPDQAAIVVKEEIVYAVNPPPPPKPEIYLGQPLYTFSGLNYEFEEFPQTQQVRKNQSVTKTRVALAPPLDPNVRFRLIVQRLAEPNQPNDKLMAFSERLLRLDPSDTPCLYWFVSQQTPEKLLEFLKTHLDDRPPLIEWHRLYQGTMERLQPATDLRPRYEKLVKETAGNADALYLLARAEPDRAKSDKLYLEAANAPVPSPYAMHTLAYNALSAGQFAEAVRWAEKAMPLLSDKTLIRHHYYQALSANRDYDRLLNELQKEMQIPGMKFDVLADMAKVHALRGEKEKSRSVLQQAVQGISGPQQQIIQAALRSQLCCWEQDRAGYLREMRGPGESFSFEFAFLKGDLEQAGAIAKKAKLDAAVFHGLLYLALVRSKDDKRAQEHWQAMLAELRKDRRHERKLADLLAGDKLPASPSWRQLSIEPRTNRVYLAVLAQRFPDQSKEILAQVRTLDFSRDAISLCLQQVLKNGKPK